MSAAIPIELASGAESLLPDMVALRRAIHAEPELGLHNPRTADKISAALAGLPLELRAGTTTSGIVAVLKGEDGPGRTVLLRGDTDALPMAEETGLPFASRIDGAAHACGHDSHTAMLAGAARLLCERRASLSGTVLLMFQPGEEGHHGARFMLEEAGLIDPLPDAAFALHIMPNAPHGVFSGRAGALLASTDRLHVEVIGRGGHASMPHDTIDPLPIACEIVLAIQSFVTRRVPVASPAIVTIGRIACGTTDNVIADTASMLGTIRTLSPETRRLVTERLPALVRGIAEAHGARADIRIETGFPVTVCDPRAVALGRATAAALFGAEAWVDLAAPNMGGEDFSYVLEKVPGAMFFLGASHAGDDWRACCALHSPRMVLDEAVMARGAALHAALAMRFLEQGFAD